MLSSRLPETTARGGEVGSRSHLASRVLSCARLTPLVALIALASGCGHSAAQPTPPLPVVPVAAPTPPRVVIFSIDGLRPDALLQAGAPAITCLAARGGSTGRGQSRKPSRTPPSHASVAGP